MFYSSECMSVSMATIVPNRTEAGSTFHTWTQFNTCVPHSKCRYFCAYSLCMYVCHWCSASCANLNSRVGTAQWYTKRLLLATWTMSKLAASTRRISGPVLRTKETIISFIPTHPRRKFPNLKLCVHGTAIFYRKVKFLLYIHRFIKHSW